MSVKEPERIGMNRGNISEQIKCSANVRKTSTELARATGPLPSE